jgi:hypothetical protein
MGRQRIPFILGEVGVSDRLTFTKLKSKLWIERGRGAVCSRLFSAESTGEVVCCCEDRRRFCCHSQYYWFSCHIICLDEEEKQLQQLGQSIFIRTTKIIQQHVIYLSMFSNQKDYSPWFGQSHTPPKAKPAQTPPPIRIPANYIASGITGIPRPLSCPFVELDMKSFVDALV